jgi:hypothetical protein
MPGGTATAAKKKPFVWYSLEGTDPTANERAAQRPGDH